MVSNPVGSFSRRPCPKLTRDVTVTGVAVNPDKNVDGNDFIDFIDFIAVDYLAGGVGTVRLSGVSESAEVAAQAHSVA